MSLQLRSWKMAVAALTVVTIVVLVFLALRVYDQSTPSSDIVVRDGPEEIRRALKNIVTGKTETGPLVITYDDIHGLYGGLRLTIRGDGIVEQKAVRQMAGIANEVTAEELAKLVQLLIKQEAWEQRIPDRKPRQDESQAHLYISYDATSTHIWEWFNDLEKNQRIGEILALMKEIVWN